MEKIVVYRDRGWSGGRAGLFNEKASIKLAEAWYKYPYMGYPSIDQLYKTKEGNYIKIERNIISPFLWWKEWKIGKVIQAFLVNKERAIKFYNDSYNKKITNYPELEITKGLKEL